MFLSQVRLSKKCFLLKMLRSGILYQKLQYVSNGIKTFFHGKQDSRPYFHSNSFMNISKFAAFSLWFIIVHSCLTPEAMANTQDWPEQEMTKIQRHCCCCRSHCSLENFPLVCSHGRETNDSAKRQLGFSAKILPFNICDQFHASGKF